LNADVVGAQSVGMPTAWLNRKGKVSPADIIPEYEIKTATELLTLSSQS
jgi:FMN phosphatase YigB (HAD superfamily)